MASCLYLHDSYITKFDFMNYAFAKRVLHVINQQSYMYSLLMMRNMSPYILIQYIVHL